MREIKFRAKRKDDSVHNGTWVYGHYFTAPLTDENSGMPPETGWFFLSGGETKHCIGQDGVAFVIDPETLGAFTGLHDKTGKEIYEKDIVRFLWTPIRHAFDYDDTTYVGALIKWCEPQLRFALYKLSGDLWMTDLSIENDDRQFDVVGNPFDGFSEVQTNA